MLIASLPSSLLVLPYALCTWLPLPASCYYSAAAMGAAGLPLSVVTVLSWLWLLLVTCSFSLVLLPLLLAGHLLGSAAIDSP